MHGGSAEGFGVDHLAGCSLHEVRSAEAHEAGLFDHEDDVAQRGQIGSAGDAGAHDGGDLGDAQAAAHERVVIEDPRGSVLAGKDAVLQGEIDAGRIHEVDDGDAVAHGDFLGAKDLGDGFGPPGSGFDGGVVGDEDGGAAFDAGESGDDAGGGGLAIVLVVGDEKTDLEEHGAGIDQPGDAFAGGELSIAMLLFDSGGSATLAKAVLQGEEFFHQGAHVIGGLLFHRGQRLGLHTLQCKTVTIRVGLDDELANTPLSLNSDFEYGAGAASGQHQPGARVFLEAMLGLSWRECEGRRAPDLTGQLKYGASDEAIEGNIRKGIPGTQMPAFAVSKEEANDIVMFLRSLRKYAGNQQTTGDPAKGQALFFGSGGCSGCHMMGGRGGGWGRT